MSLATISDAITQYNANLGWNTSQASAQLALEAVQFLLINRAQKLDDRGSAINFESLQTEKAALEKFLGATAPRSFGRSRTCHASFSGRESIE